MEIHILIYPKIYYFILISIISYCKNYLVIPFTIKIPKLKTNNNLINASEYLKYSENNQIALNIYMGTPKKEIEIYLTMEKYEIILGKGFCLQNTNSLYDPILSSTYEKTPTNFFSPLYTNGSLSKDSFLFYNNLNFSQNISIEEIEFIYGIASPDFFDNIYPDSCCGYLGLQFTSGSPYFEWDSLIYHLKSNGNINSKYWSLIFYDYVEKKKNNNYDGILIIGIVENDYKDIFNIKSEDDYNKTYTAEYGYKNKNWEIKFNEIYYNINKQNFSFFNDIQGKLVIDHDYIVGNNEYFNSILENFFNKYINEGICFIDKNKTLKKTKKSDYQLINVIICDKNKFKEKKKFPTLYLKHIDLYKIFELNYKDLFQEIGNSIIFSIVLDENDKYHWSFGRIFLKKYQFIFDNEQKTITYMKTYKTINEEVIKEKNKLVIILKIMIIIFLIVGFGLGLFLGKNLWEKNRKKRANELDDDYEYIEKNDKNENPESGLFEEK